MSGLLDADFAADVALIEDFLPQMLPGLLAADFLPGLLDADFAWVMLRGLLATDAWIACRRFCLRSCLDCLMQFLPGLPAAVGLLAAAFPWIARSRCCLDCLPQMWRGLLAADVASIVARITCRRSVLDCLMQILPGLLAAERPLDAPFVLLFSQVRTSACLCLPLRYLT